MKKAITLLMAASMAATAFPGMLTGSWSIVKFTSNTEPRLPEQFSLYSLGASFTASPLVNVVVNGEYGAGSPSEPPVSPEAGDISDENGRIWLLDAGADATLPGMEMFFLRGTAGAAYILMDYGDSESDYMMRETQGDWESSISLGVGSRFELGGFPLLNSLEFSLNYRRIGEFSLMGGEIALGI